MFSSELNLFTYPGRFLICTKINNFPVILYGVTARNPSSKAKRYVYDDIKKEVHVEPTDKHVFEQGDVTLLDYTAVKLFSNGVVVGNGRQTDIITELKLTNAKEQLDASLSEIDFEKDKYCTPRITACVVDNTIAMHHVFSDKDENSVRKTYELHIEPGKAYFLSTYSGENIRPTPSFKKEPIQCDFSVLSLQEAVDDVYNYFAPKDNEDDLRVSVIGAHLEDEPNIIIKNAI